MGIDQCRKINLKKIDDARGSLTVVEGTKDIPFEIKRIYYIYNIPAGEYRGTHAHRKLEQLMIAVSGSFDVIADDGSTKVKFHLSKPFEGLYIPQMIWREMSNFSSGTVCLVLASEIYDESDYIRNYGEYLNTVREKKMG